MINNINPILPTSTSMKVMICSCTVSKYRCVDIDIPRTDKETSERLVNINTISQLIYNGVKYVVE